MSVVPLSGDDDPDKLVQEGRIDILHETEDAVSYLLQHDPALNNYNLPFDVRYRNILNFIVSVTNSTVRFRMYSQIVAESLSIMSDDILNDLEKLSRGIELQSTDLAKVRKLFDNIPIMTSVEMLDTVEKAQSKLQEIVSKRDDSITTYTWNKFNRLLRNEDKLPFVFKTGFDDLDSKCTIEAKSLTIISGRPSNGKSSLIRDLVVRFPKYNDDTLCLYVTTDDSDQKAMVNILGVITNTKKRDVDTAMRDGDYSQYPSYLQHADEIREFLTNSLCLLGLDKCPNVSSIKRVVESYRSRYPDKNIMVIVDAVNNLRDVQSGDDQRPKIEMAITDFKTMAVNYNLGMIIVSHLKKPENSSRPRPTANDLKGTTFFEYEAKTVILLHMDFHYNKDTKLVWRTPIGEIAPIVEVGIVKDKDNEGNDLLPFKFHASVGKFYSPDSEAEREKYLRFIGESTGKRHAEPATTSQTY